MKNCSPSAAVVQPERGAIIKYAARMWEVDVPLNAPSGVGLAFVVKLLALGITLPFSPRSTADWPLTIGLKFSGMPMTISVIFSLRPSAAYMSALANLKKGGNQ